MAANAEELRDLYKELSYPSAKVFHQALKRRGIPARLKDIEEFVRSRSERQVIAPGPKWDGNIVAFDRNHRWAADLIAFTSKPAKSNEGTFTHVLLVQDIFTRMLYARPLKSVTDATDALKSIIEDPRTQGRGVPSRLDTDGAPEFDNGSFKALMREFEIQHVIKDKNDLQAIATLDRAIGVLKRMIKRTREAEGGTWLTHLDATVKAYNNTEHGGIDHEPAKVDDTTTFRLMKEAAEDLQENTEIIKARQAKLERDGTYRTYVPKTGKGLRRRVDATTWSKDIRQVANFPEPGIVQDTDGNRTLTKLAKPVPSDSSAIAAKTRAPREDMRAYASTLANKLPGAGASFGQAAKIMKREPGFIDKLKASRQTFQQFVGEYPDMIFVHDGRIRSRRQQTL